MIIIVEVSVVVTYPGATIWAAFSTSSGDALVAVTAYVTVINDVELNAPFQVSVG